MKKIILLAAIFMTMTTMEAAKPKSSLPTEKQLENAAQAASAPEFKTAKDSVSYAIGVSMASQLGSIPYEFNHSLMLEGFKAGIEKKSLFDESKLQAILTQWQQDMMASQQAQQDKAQSAGNEQVEANKKAGSEFLAKNAVAEGVKTTPSGLQYKVLVEGTGAKPAATDKVEVHYEGTLLDGTVFDSSIKRGQSITFGLNQVIKGWTEGVQLMSEGSKYIFYIPSDLAYGDRGAGGSIPGGSTLIFEVELIKVNP
ncbi:MAG: FKBP-type peptidyl-prolyl cis-trans isomerase [Bacteroidales bacterium]|jgi:FKBP-type peptidyl-prolyl cis-trans isomerase|nr:FKBP-type peptidyl-prolyl cis-trans isomerase [Bacteroidales bacterium]